MKFHRCYFLLKHSFRPPLRKIHYWSPLEKILPGAHLAFAHLNQFRHHPGMIENKELRYFYTISRCV